MDAGAVTVRLPYRPPLHHDGLMAFLGARAIAGIEVVDGDTYRRVLRLSGGPAVAEVRPGTRAGPPHLECTLWPSDRGDVPEAVRRLRRLLDLDADPVLVDAHLGADPLLAPLVSDAPGRRSPGAADGDELAVRAVLGQQVSVAAARTLAGRLVATLGEPLSAPRDGLTHVFPDMATLARAGEEQLPAMPTSRRRTLQALAAGAAAGALRLVPDEDPDEVERRLLALPGVGPWTAGYIRMRALGDGDVFLPTDVGVRNALRRLGCASDPVGAGDLAQGWAPWRSYALHHLWASAAVRA
ncbi:DNA-3-methyladenine glycosylase [Actinotalea sp. Marseille-Q4924]|uniref:DNA-3-methyladenine glycosylase family protein n=1 Tax=Actinotalea sp. Marseille-Q4924 TaxID=2866571 RepID=UPI001CE49B21|nr:AlkA N-terminal domain-containing protein [Actinotalea sp. Marseille-Q4924]